MCPSADMQFESVVGSKEEPASLWYRLVAAVVAAWAVPGPQQRYPCQLQYALLVDIDVNINGPLYYLERD